eukprot:5871-Heterococcus_DN1.PRE.5
MNVCIYCYIDSKCNAIEPAQCCAYASASTAYRRTHTNELGQHIAAALSISRSHSAALLADRVSWIQYKRTSLQTASAYAISQQSSHVRRTQL